MAITVLLEGKEAQRCLGDFLTGPTSGERQDQQSNLSGSDSEAQPIPLHANLEVTD